MLISLEVSSDWAPVLCLVLCLNNVSDDFRVSLCQKVKSSCRGLWAVQELPHRALPAVHSVAVAATNFLVRLPGVGASRLPHPHFTPRVKPVDPSQEAKERKAYSLMCMFTEDFGQGSSMPEFLLSLPTGCRLSLMAGTNCLVSQLAKNKR